MSALNSDCTKIQESLSAYLDHEQVDAPDIEQHLSTCSNCQEELKGLKQVKAALKALPASVSQKDFTGQLESQLKNNKVVYANFSSKAVAAVLISLVGAFGLWAVTHQNNTPEKQTTQIAVKENIVQPEKMVKTPPAVIASNPAKEVAIKETSKAKIDTPPRQTKETAKTEIAKVEPDTINIKITSKPINIALNSPELSSEDGLFNEMGFSSDEDGLYAIKL